MGAPPNEIGLWIFKKLIELRYDVQVKGLDEILANGNSNMFIFSEHSGYIDPPLNLYALLGKINVRPIMTENMAKGPFGFAIKALLGGVNGILLPDPTSGGKTSGSLAKATLREASHANSQGDNPALWPAGGVKTGPNEQLGNKSAVYELLQQSPDARIILVRQRGIWGSSFTHGGEGADPNKKLTSNEILKRGLITAIKTLVSYGFIFTPKRPRVTLEFFEPEEFSS